MPQDSQEQLATVRCGQSQLARELAVLLVSDGLANSVRSILYSIVGREVASQIEGMMDLDPDDKEAWQQAVTAEVERSVFVAIVAYTTFLTEEFRRDHERMNDPYEPRRLRELSKEELSRLTTRYGAESHQTVLAVYTILLQYDGPFPPLGRLTNGVLTPDPDQLKAWWRSENGSMRPKLSSLPRSKRLAMLRAEDEPPSER